MAQQIKLKRSASQGNEPTPSQLELGEIAINTHDGRVFIKKDNGIDDPSIVTVNPASTDGLSEGSSNLYFTNQKARDAIDGNPLSEIDYIDFAVQAPPAHLEGRVFYDYGNDALAVYNAESDITLQVGQEEWIRVYNNSGSTINNGTPVYLAGQFNDVPTIGKAGAGSEMISDASGIATHTIENASYGYVTCRGVVGGLDTSGLTAGERVHVGVSVGTLQTMAPTYPYFPTDVGICLVSNSVNGCIYVDVQQHSFETIRVSGNSHFDQNVTIEGNLIVSGTQSVVSSNNLSVDDSFVYLNSGDTIGASNTTFTGSGLDDAIFKGHFEATTTKNYYVAIDGVGTGTGGVDTFKWSYNSDFSSPEATTVDITGAAQALEHGISIEFNATTGHTSADAWNGSASPVNVDSGWFSNRNTGTSGIGYTHMGIFFDASDAKFKLVEEYDLEPEGTINTSHASFSLGTLVGGFEGSFINTLGMTGNGDIDISGDITTSGTLTAANLALGGNTTLSWNATDNTMDLDLGTATLQLGQESYIYGKASSAISDGELVMFAGVQGDYPLVAPANLTAPGFRPEWIIGIATADIALNAYGYVTNFGKVRDIDTSSFTEGQLLYADPATNGALTATEPTAPNPKITVAAVLRSDSTAGTLLVRPTISGTLTDLADVHGDPSDNSRLEWDAGNQRFVYVANNLSTFNNDMWEITSTEPTNGSGKPAGYVWYIV